MNGRFEKRKLAMPKTIISSGLNVALLRVRNAIIQQAGYAVLTSKESAMVLEMAAKDHVGAVAGTDMNLPPFPCDRVDRPLEEGCRCGSRNSL
jgi:hypothetical protein